MNVIVGSYQRGFLDSMLSKWALFIIIIKKKKKTKKNKTKQKMSSIYNTPTDIIKLRHSFFLQEEVMQCS